MLKFIALLSALVLTATSLAADRVLIVADEFPAMEFLAKALKTQEGIDADLVAQDKLPERLADYRAVIVYIHGKLNPEPEKAFIAYTQAGGRLVALHHSISSGKRRNAGWFPFLGVDLLPGNVEDGGYKWIEPATIECVNLAPDHFITTHKVEYPGQIAYTPSEVGGGYRLRPGFVLHESEAYLNHTLTEPRTLLLGLKYTDPGTGKLWMQDRAGWLRPSGSGLIAYFQPGHSLLDFQQPAYTRIVINAVIFQP
jgi:hypothetical protein